MRLEVRADNARHQEGDTFTQVVQFEVEPDKQAALIAAIVAEVERWVRHRPGFVSSTFHASLDGRHGGGGQCRSPSIVARSAKSASASDGSP